MKNSLIKRALFSGLLALTTLASAAIAALPVAASNPPTIALEGKSVGNGETFTVNLDIDSDPGIKNRSWQAVVLYDPAKLEVVSPKVTYGSYYSDWAGTHDAGTNPVNPPTVDNTNGSVFFGNAVTGATGEGPDGDGLMASITFHAKAGGDNSIAHLGIKTTGTNPFSKLNGVQSPPNALTVNWSGSNIVIGTPGYPDHQVAAAGTSGTGNSYSLSFTITNTGTAPASASTATYSIDGGTPVDVSILGLGIGESDSHTITGLTVSPNSDSIAIVADSSNAVEESNEGNNTRSCSYTVYPDLTISAVTSGSDANYAIEITVTNGGFGNAPASTATYSIDGGTPVDVPIDALLAGAFQVVTINKTVSGNGDSISVVADAPNAIQESNETNNTAGASYTNPNPVIEGGTPIDGTVDEVMTFQAPDAVDSWNHPGYTPNPSGSLKPGDNTSLNKIMTVTTNYSWIVKVQGENGGFMRKWNTTTRTYSNDSPVIKLGTQLHLAVTGEQEAYLNDSAQIFADGSPADLTTSYTREVPVEFKQALLFSDKGLLPGYNYHMDVDFIFEPTAY